MAQELGYKPNISQGDPFWEGVVGTSPIRGEVTGGTAARLGTGETHSVLSHEAWGMKGDPGAVVGESVRVNNVAHRELL